MSTNIVKRNWRRWKPVKCQSEPAAIHKRTSNRYRSDRRMHAYHSHDGRSDLYDVRCFGVNRVKRSTFREQKVGFFCRREATISWWYRIWCIWSASKTTKNINLIHCRIRNLISLIYETTKKSRTSNEIAVVIWDCWYFICLLDESVASVFDIRFAVQEISKKCKSRHSNVFCNENELDFRLIQFESKAFSTFRAHSNKFVVKFYEHPINSRAHSFDSRYSNRKLSPVM